MKAKLHPEQIRRLMDLTAARQLAEAGLVVEARRIFASYGIGHVAVEINRTKSRTQ